MDADLKTEGQLKRRRYDPKRRFIEKSRPFVESHRGVNREEPENTLSAFKRAIEIGCDSIELDVWLTKDDVPVVIHGKDDGEIQETTLGAGCINAITLRELSEIMVKGKDEGIPSLLEVFQLCKDKIFINIEIKDKSHKKCLDQVLSIVRELNMDDQIAISSFQHEYWHELRKMNEFIEFGFLYDTTEGQTCEFCFDQDRKNNTLNVWYKEVTPELVEKAHKNELAVHCWFCMADVETEDIFRYLFNCGVDVVCTNSPSLAMKIRDEIYGK